MKSPRFSGQFAVQFLAPLIVVVTCLSLTGCMAVTQTAHLTEKPNVIFMIGDGMGPAYTSAYRLYRDDPATPLVETTVFDDLLVGMASTSPIDPELITDSAAAATALATGVKTFNGAIAVDTEKQALKTILESARENGYQTGLVVTSAINHATPASFVAHVDSRNKYDEIADQYIESRINGKPKLDLLIGGGRKYFEREDRNVLEEFVKEGYTAIHTLDGLKQLESLPAIALLSHDAMKGALDSDYKTRLATMTEKALSLLAEKPFFLLIEASQIDWSGHANDIAWAMAEVHDFASTIALVKTFIDQNPNTVLVVTADHATGGLSLGADENYQWLPGVIRNIRASSVLITRKLSENNERWELEWEASTGIALSDEEREAFQLAINDIMEAKENDASFRFDVSNRLILAVHYLVVQVFNDRTHSGWTGRGHTGEDVQVFSYGKYAAEFAGHRDNTEISRIVATHLEE